MKHEYLVDHQREWTDSKEGKAAQCMVFKLLVDGVMKELKHYKDKEAGLKQERFKWFMREYPEIKLANSGLTKTQIVMAVHRLLEHELLFMAYHSKGNNIRITKKGWERWNKKK